MSSESMFSRVNIRSDLESGQIDLGFLAECLVFYDSVYVIGGAAILNQLVDAAGSNGLEALFKTGALKFLFHPATPCVFTLDQRTSVERHDFAFIEQLNQQTKKKLTLQGLVSECLNNDQLARKWASPEKGYVRQSGIQRLNLVEARKRLWNDVLLQDLLNRWLIVALPNETHLHNKCKVKTWLLTNELQVSCNIDFADVAAGLRQTLGPNSPFNDLNFAHFLSLILEVYSDIYFAANNNADVARTRFGSPLIEALAAHSFQAAERKAGEIFSFQEHVLSDSRAISEAINSGEREFADIVPIVEKSRRFKSWLAKRDPDVSVVSAYISDVTKDTWAERLPFKAVRWVVVNAVSKGLDAVAGAGIAVEAFDNVVLDKLLKGWRPNQFVNGKLQPFVKPPTSK